MKTTREKYGNLEGDVADRLWLQPGIVMAMYI